MSDTVEQAFIAPRYLAGIGDPGWVTGRCTGSPAGVTGGTR
ncbi:hypothetical protein [Streptomyces sp. NPDC002790]